MRLSPWDSQFPRKKLKRETRSFPVDPRQPDGPAIRLTFEELDECGLGVATDKAREYEERFIENREPLLTPDGRRIRMSRYLCRVVAKLEAMERPEEGDNWPAGSEPYTLVDWCGIAMKFETAWRQIVEWGSSFIAAEDAEGNSPTATDPTPIGMP